jgi:hypothetical protein
LSGLTSPFNQLSVCDCLIFVNTCRKHLRDRLQLLNEQLQANLNNNYSVGKQKVIEVINDGVAPFSRLLRAEKESSAELAAKISELRVKIRELRSKI